MYVPSVVVSDGDLNEQHGEGSSGTCLSSLAAYLDCLVHDTGVVLMQDSLDGGKQNLLIVLCQLAQAGDLNTGHYHADQPPSEAHTRL